MPGKFSNRKKKNKQESNTTNKTEKGSINKESLIESSVPLWVNQGLFLIMLVGLIMLMLIGSFQRGLFFPRELLVAQVAVFGILFIWGLFRLVNKDNRFIRSPLDICILLLLVAYLVSFFFAVHVRDGLEEILKIASYLVVYLVAIDLCRYMVPLFPRLRFFKSQTNEEETDDDLGGQVVVLHLLFFIALIITIASIGAAAGHWDFVGAYASSRIASPMGYANTAAAYLMATYFLTLALASLAGRRFRLFYLVPAAIILLTVILTFSRGAWLLLPPLALLLVIVSAPGEKLRSLLYMSATAIAALPAALLADPVLRASASFLAWLYILSSAVVAVLLGWLSEFYLSQSPRIKYLFAGAGSFLLALSLIIFIIMPVIGPISIEQPVETSGRMEMVSQVIGNVELDQDYELILEVNARDTGSFVDDSEYVWGLRVLGGLPGYRNEELINYRGGDTDGWQEKRFSFRTKEETTRLEIQIFSRYQGTAVDVRSVYLKTSDRDQKINFALNRILPQRFYDRIFSYSRDRNLDRRLELFEDAIKVIRDYPLTGTGGGGWAAIYHSYQDQPYSSREIHNHYLQVWVEAGIFGFIAFVGIWISCSVSFIRNCIKGRASDRRWKLWTAVFLPVAALGAHSAIDWNFSMAAVGFYLFVLLGIANSLDRTIWFANADQNEKAENIKASKGVIVGLVGIVFGIALFAYSIVLLIGLDTTWRSQEIMDRGNIKQAVIEMEKALKLDPFRAENYHNLAVIIEDNALRTQNPAEIEKVLSLAERAYQLEPYNPAYVSRYGDLLFNYVGIEEGFYYIDQMLTLRPYVDSSYIHPAWARLRLMEYFAENNSKRELEKYYNEIFEIRDLMDKVYGDSSAMAYILGRASYLNSRLGDALFFYRMVEEEDQFFNQAQGRLIEMLGNNNDLEEDDDSEEDDDNES